MIADQIEKELKKLGTKERAKTNAWFFKSGPGQYGEGDLFLGVTVPNVRKVIKNYVNQSELKDAETLLSSPYHEVRLSGAILYVELYKKAAEASQARIFKSYLKNAKRFNNWDLVDTSAPIVAGGYLFNNFDQKERDTLLDKLSESKNLWENRIAMLACWYDIRKGKTETAFRIAEKFLNHKHDLMHKAVGWMLREVGKNCGQETLNIFLEKHAHAMPRTTLRYALERHLPVQRAIYMARRNMVK